ncbi:hypothetical protein GCM10009712_33670 [Pseudarthrobacter sulfonivorans]
MADIARIVEPMHRILPAQTHGKPAWSRVGWAELLLVHAYTHSGARHSAPSLTGIAFINWWEGRGSKAHQFLELALEADPNYRQARLRDRMIGTGPVAGRSMDKGTAYRGRGLEASQAPQSEGYGRRRRPDRSQFSTAAFHPSGSEFHSCVCSADGKVSSVGSSGRRVTNSREMAKGVDRSPSL